MQYQIPLLGIECWVYRNFSMPVRQKSIECWVLNVGYTVIFPMPSQAKKYECWVLGIEYLVLGIEQFTVIFQYPVSQKYRKYKFFFQYPIPKIQGPTENPALRFLVGTFLCPPKQVFFKENFPIFCMNFFDGTNPGGYSGHKKSVFSKICTWV